MSRATPRIWVAAWTGEAYLEDAALPAGRLWLDTPAWFAWLEAPSTTRFSYALFNRAKGYIDGFITLRKEQRQRGRAYWSAYRRQGQRVRKLYLGPSTALTHDQLERLAARFQGQPASPQPSSSFHDPKGDPSAQI